MSKSIFITGASKGIGREVAKEFSKNGYKVITCARNINSLKELSKEAKKKKLCDIPYYKTDISNKNNVTNTIKRLVNEHGVPDLIFLNAGTNNPNSKKIFSLKEVRNIFEVNFFGTLNCIEAILPHLKKNKKNVQIIIMASVAGYRGLPYSAAYCSSKSALINFAESIVHQCEAQKIKLRIVNPGFIKTPLTDKNNFKMPMIISANKAAIILYNKIVKTNNFEIVLPSFFCYLMKLLRIMPYFMYLRLTKLILKKL